MSDLEFTGGFDITDALQSVDTLATELQSRIDEALGNISIEAFTSTLLAAADDAFSTPIPIEADASAIPAEIDSALADASAAVAIDADTAPAASEVGDLVATVDGETATLTVDADTTDAQSAVDDLSSSIDSAGGSASGANAKVGGLGLSTGQLAGVAGLAVGEVGGLREASSLLGERTAVATTGALGLAAGIGELYAKGIEAVSAEERFNLVLGETAQRVKEVNVGDLSTDLFKLTSQMGSTDAATRNGAATIFQFAVNAGATRQQSAQFTDQLFVLASRAVALKPSLGDVADVATRMEVGLGRARSAAQQFGISISQAEINQRALTDTGKASASELTAYEKSVAGAEIAVQRYGSTLKNTITEGSQNAAIEQRRLKASFDDFLASAGKPLVAPALDLIRQAIPVGKDLAAALSDVASVAIPLLSGALQILGPAIEPVVVGFLAMKAASLAAAGLSALAGGVEVLAGSLPALAIGETTAAAATETFAGGIATASISVGALSSAAIPGAIAAFGSYEATTWALHAAQDALFGPTESYADRVKDLTSAVQSVDGPTQGMVGRFTDVVRAIGPVQPNLAGAAITLGAFKEVAKQNVGVAAQLAEQFPKTSATYRGMQLVLKDLQGAQDAQKKSADDQAASVQRVTGSIDMSSKAYIAAATEFGDYAASVAAKSPLTETQLGDIAKSATALDTATATAFNSATSLVQQFSSAVTVSTTDINNALVLQVAAATQWSSDLKSLAAAGIDQGLIDELRKAGPKAEPLITGLLADVAAGNVGAINSAEQSLKTILDDTNSTLDQMTLTGAIKFSEFAAVANARLKDLKEGGTKNLDALRTTSDQELTQMATDVETQMGRVGIAINSLPKSHDTKITADVSQAFAALDALREKYANVPGIGIITAHPTVAPTSGDEFAAAIAFAQANGRAAGGSVEAGMPYLVNEQTPRSEIFVPKEAGAIMPRSVWDALSSASTAAGSVQPTDNSIRIDHIDARGLEDPVRTSLAVGRRLRSENFLRT